MQEPVGCIESKTPRPGDTRMKDYDGSFCFKCRISLPKIDLDVDHHGNIVPRYCKTCEEAIWNASGLEMPDNARVDNAWEKLQQQED